MHTIPTCTACHATDDLKPSYGFWHYSLESQRSERVQYYVCADLAACEARIDAKWDRVRVAAAEAERYLAVASTQIDAVEAAVRS